MFTIHPEDTPRSSQTPADPPHPGAPCDLPALVPHQWPGSHGPASAGPVATSGQALNFYLGGTLAEGRVGGPCPQV